jgi:hypothetical protein
MRFVIVAMVATSLVSLLGCKPAEEPVAAKPRIETRKTLGQTTQNVLELGQALASGGVLAETSITSEGLEVVSDAYRTSVGKVAVIAVEQRMRQYQAVQDKLPATYTEFMEKIIEAGTPSGMQLPMLPYYQEYAYDPEQKVLVVVEFPEKKKQREQETTGAAGL